MKVYAVATVLFRVKLDAGEYESRDTIENIDEAARITASNEVVKAFGALSHSVEIVGEPKVENVELTVKR